MRDFITCLEFLTRIRFSKRDTWTKEDFSRSVPYFPLVGLIIGGFLALVNTVLIQTSISDFLRASLLILAEIIITGGLMYDGFMDTADGVFSARDRERMLEIMKDSCVGSNAVLAVIVLIMLKISVYLEMPPAELSFIIIAMSVATRTFMVLFIVNFPYARKEGIGNLFRMYAKPYYTYIAFFLGMILIYAAGGFAVLTVAGLCLFILLMVANYFVKLLGGLTGDTYGALTEIGNVIFLLLIIFMRLGGY